MRQKKKHISSGERDEQLLINEGEVEEHDEGHGFGDMFVH